MKEAMSEVFKSIISEINAIGSYYEQELTNAMYASHVDPPSIDLTRENLERAIQKIIQANKGLRGEQL